ncbi:methylated-DNA--[protein]-cysteine S-methyltransferase [Gordonibacter massiliensis (ex Traore et al. 2017)]|nr:methylated-DNA--[protein]-cysteine S-methyltransferase [Gordonibacter massiliensis (ex Traore et al. 2017)]
MQIGAEGARERSGRIIMAPSSTERRCTVPGSTPTHFAYRTPLGRVTIASDGRAVTALAFGEQTLPGAARATELTNRAANQLQEYFAGKRRAFDLPLAPAGTDFQKRVWKAVADVPYGETRTYSDVAAAIGSPRSCRAVGAASNKNPLPILIPCHRIVGANGSPAGSGNDAKAKAFLLDMERRAAEGRS